MNRSHRRRRHVAILLTLTALWVEPGPPARAAQQAPGQPRTRVSIVDGKWHINGQVTYPGARAEGLLMNVRMVNSTFEDRNKRDFDSDANTARFIARIGDYAACGVRAFTLNLQGGMPGYEGALNSAFNPDGSLREEYLARMARVIEACDRSGVVVILGCYYQRQSGVLKDEAAIRAGVVNAVNWLRRRQYANVVLEIANEYPHGGFKHRLLKSPAGQVELIRLARRTWGELLVSTSGVGKGRLDDEVARASDFLLIHFNGTAVEEIPARIAALRKHAKPIVCNEDDKQGRQAARAAEACVAGGASYGLMLSKLNQYVPFEFNGPKEDPVAYERFRELTGPASKGH